MEIKDDGTQTLTFKIPKYFLSEVPNERITNPRWKDTENGVLAENTRVLKVTIEFDDETKVYPFIIDQIVNKRDNNFSVYKEVTGNGLAFAELGKIGYKLELTADILEQDFAEDSSVVANVNYWLDKVFPNVRDEAGNVIRWLTPWSYEIRMDWRGYAQDPSDFFIDGGTAAQFTGYSFYNGRGAKEVINGKDKNWMVINSGTSAKLYQIRDEEVIYEDAYVASWITNKEETALLPVEVTSFEEKARYVNCQNSNKYNITQSIAEAFGVFCTYEYQTDSHGYFKGTYWDELGRVWTGKKVVFYNRAVKTDNPFTINYQHNLQSISRTIDSSEIYTKLYVTPLESEISDTGYISIADTPSNPLLDEFILNFDYIHDVGSVTDEQYEWIEKNYKPHLHSINRAYAKLEEEFNDLQIQLNEAEAKLATAKNELASAQEQLGNYQALRDNDTYKQPIQKDTANAYSVTMVPQTATEICQGTFRVTGIDGTTIECYNNNEYQHNSNDNSIGAKKCLFSYSGQVVDTQGEVKMVPKPTFTKTSPGTAAAMPEEWFIKTDEDGFPETVYTSLSHSQTGEEGKEPNTGTFTKNFSTGAVFYFKLSYWPKNKYAAVCSRFETVIAEQTATIEALNKQIDCESEKADERGLKQNIEINELARKELLDEKEKLNYEFERLLGPAVREGYWQAEDYEDPGQGYNVVLSAADPHPERNTYFIFDEKPFEEEQKNYYLIATDVANYGPKYYPYIDLSNIYNTDIMDNVDNFVIELEHPQFSGEITEESFPAGYYKLVYNSQFYYIDLTTALPKGTKIYLNLDPSKPTVDKNGIREVIFQYQEKDGALTTCSWISQGDLETTYKDKIFIDITQRFANLQSFLGVRSLYNNAGFKLCFMDTNKDPKNQHIIPIALLQETDINYEDYTSVSCAASSTDTRIDAGLVITTDNGNEDKQYPIVYPRIKIDYRNVNYESDNLTIRCNVSRTVNPDGTEEVNDNLVKYEDYQILLRGGKPHITLKITNHNLMKYILGYDYNIIYQVSRANEMLYLDARQVAKDNSKPKYSYEVEIGNIPDEMKHVELGQLVYVCDHTIDAERERGYVSEIKYQLDQPSKDTFTIANYKTKFEDLFSSLTAQNEAMKQNQTSYNIAAQAFQANGEISEKTLQNTLNNTEAQFTFGNNTISLDKNGGMVLTNESAYHNGVYGQIKLIGGGIYCSDSLDAKGDRLWSTGITPQGINASLITAGQIDTKYIRILSGDQTRFQWNESGLYAFGSGEATEEGTISIDTNTYVRLNENGLLFQQEGKELLSLGWDGLRIGAQDGAVQISSTNGLEVYNKSNKRLIALGRHQDDADDNKALYGLAMYNVEGSKTLYTDQNGNLHLDGKLTVGNGEGYVCINGAAKGDTDFVLYAGNEQAEEAEFALRRDGKIFCKNVECKLVPVSET